MLADYSTSVVALYRAARVMEEDTDDISSGTAYLYTCPQPNSVVRFGDQALVLGPEHELLRLLRYCGSSSESATA
jgi:hypothetical protein